MKWLEHMGIMENFCIPRILAQKDRTPVDLMVRPFLCFVVIF